MNLALRVRSGPDINTSPEIGLLSGVSGHHRNLGSASAGFSFADLNVDLVVEGVPML